MRKKIILVGTNHGVQGQDFNGTNQFQKIIIALMVKHDIQLIFEEWDWLETSWITVGHKIAIDRSLPWKNVGTPNEPEYETCSDFLTSGGAVTVYTPTTQSTREICMLGNIRQTMKDYNAGMFILGLAHMQSMSEKLILLGFEIEAYEWQKPK